ncbi:pleckstrin homology-like domain family B member 1 [Culicoides brevitarsis]|uniref:pleckstrin homology-like domain family B member 1 n=1 Tax=Culicoides brevitarsis TaxID=469753 RepID=UPI00307B207D
MPTKPTTSNFNGTTVLHNNNNSSSSSSSSTTSSSVLNNNSCTAAAQIMLNGFAKNSTPINNSVNFAQNNTTSDKLRGIGGGGGGAVTSTTTTGDTKNNNLNSATAYANVTADYDYDLPNLEAPKKVNNVKLHLPSPAYDRYPSKNLGQMKVYPITTPDRDEPVFHANGQKPQQQQPPANNDDSMLRREEQERLDEILLICTEYEKQNQTPTHGTLVGSASPIVQNRIKTNGSLPREKKNLSPLSPTGNSNGIAMSPLDSPKPQRASEYENLHDSKRTYMNLPLKETSNTASGNGYENVFQIHKKNVPQSPRTRIRTCISPKVAPAAPPEIPANRANEYDAIIKSFEEKLKVEIQLLQNQEETPVPSTSEGQTSTSPEISSSDNSSLLLERQTERSEIIKTIRHLKTQIADLENQQEEVHREMDVEKALVTAELSSEHDLAAKLEQDLAQITQNLHRAEAQRNANRVMQETNQAKLKQAIDVKQEHLKRLESLLETDKENEDLCKEQSKISDELENDIKVFEDLEFQYFEEETEWQQQRDEMQKDLQRLRRQVMDKREHIKKLEKQDSDSHATACLDTKHIETQIFGLLKDLEVNRERLKVLDKEIFEISGQELDRDTDTEEDESDQRRTGVNNVMSQSLFGSQEMLNQGAAAAKNDLMSKSMNENMLLTNLETGKRLDFSYCNPVPKPKRHQTFDMNKEISDLLQTKGDKLQEADNGGSPKLVMFQRSTENVSDPLLKLKYQLPDSATLPRVVHADKKRPKSQTQDLNLSLEEDNFTVDPGTPKRIASQDDIDRISKITNDSPLVSSQGASDKVKESIKEIEKNRQLLLAQQGSHLIDFEKRKMDELRKRSQDEARAKYQLEQQKAFTSSLPRNVNVTRSPKVVHKDTNNVPYLQYQQQLSGGSSDGRPLSELSECSFEGNFQNLQNQSTPNRKEVIAPAASPSLKSENRNSIQSENSSEGAVVRRNMPKHQRPLTRYLPIFSDLNLREHIESAGHQIALCPHVFVDRTTCKGYLHKIGNYFGWSKRWFVLDRDKRALIYYTDKSEKKVRGGAYFSAIDEVYLDHLNVTKSNRPHSTFIVKTKKRLYHLQAPSDQAARIWIDAIITGAQGNLSEFYE